MLNGDVLSNGRVVDGVVDVLVVGAGVGVGDGDGVGVGDGEVVGDFTCLANAAGDIAISKIETAIKMKHFELNLIFKLIMRIPPITSPQKRIASLVQAELE